MNNEMPEWLEKEKEKSKRELESAFVEAANRCGISWIELYSLILDDTANYCFQKCYELMSQRQNDIMLKQELKIEQLKESMKPRPIEGAPKDGTEILVGFDRCVSWERGHIDGPSDNLLLMSGDLHPVGRLYTHWLPLPSIDVSVRSEDD